MVLEKCFWAESKNSLSKNSGFENSAKIEVKSVIWTKILLKLRSNLVKTSPKVPNLVKKKWFSSKNNFLHCGKYIYLCDHQTVFDNFHSPKSKNSLSKNSGFGHFLDDFHWYSPSASWNSGFSPKISHLKSL